MDLILWRHAEAEPGEPDMGRGLTPKGHKQAARMGEWLDRRLPQACRVVVSPADRAQQTALGLKRKFRTADVLAPGGDPAAILAYLKWPDGRDPVLVVGHQPTLGQLASWLMTGVEAGWSIRKGAVWWLSQREADQGERVVLRAVIGPDLV